MAMAACSFGEAKSQYLETGLKAYAGLAHSQSFEWGKNGSGLELAYLHRLESGALLKGGLEAATCGLPS